MIVGRDTLLLDTPLSAVKVPPDWRGQYVVVADGEVDRAGRLVAGDILARSRTYHGALRAVGHLGPINRRIALRRLA